MDINYLGGAWVGTLTGSASGAGRILSFMAGLMSNETFPEGSEVLGPFYLGFEKDNHGSWHWEDMFGIESRAGSPCLGCIWGLEHATHIHVGWGTGYGVPQY